MEPTPEIIDELFRERILRARRTPPGDKAYSGPELFDYVCMVMDSGIRSQFPSATDDEVRRMRRERLALAQRLEQTE